MVLLLLPSLTLTPVPPSLPFPFHPSCSRTSCSRTSCDKVSGLNDKYFNEMIDDEYRVAIILPKMRWIVSVREKGILDFKSISAYSGHCRPTDDHLDTVVLFLIKNGDHNQVEVYQWRILKKFQLPTDNYNNSPSCQWKNLKQSSSTPIVILISPSLSPPFLLSVLSNVYSVSPL